MNVLLTCAGGRAYLLKAFKDAVAGGGLVLACDASADAPALQLADRGFVVPEIHDPRYVSTLVERCRCEGVDLLVPAMEHELVLLAAHRAEFEAVGTLPLVSAPDVIETCYDKLAAAVLLDGCGVRTPRTYVSMESALDGVSKGEVTYPLVVKPRWGVGSIGLMFAADGEELEAAWTLVGRTARRSLAGSGGAREPGACVLIQERVVGDEHGFDVVNDLHGRYVATLVRRKLRMRAGQTDRAETLPSEVAATIGEQIGRGLGHVGVLDCDAIRSSSGFVILDINPRIGGGYPFSHLAGANVPAALLAWAAGREADPAWLAAHANVRGARHDSFLPLTEGLADQASSLAAVGAHA